MKKEILLLVVVGSLFFGIPGSVSAHPGKTDGSGCHYCRTNCSKWGLNNNEYHCHKGDTYTNTSGQTYNSSGSLIGGDAASDGSDSSNHNSNNAITPPLKQKSSDNILKSVSIDGETIVVANTMVYKTKNETINILVELNDEKATYDIDNASLHIGENTINIKVTAENGDVKNYHLLVNREKLSNNTNVKIMIDGKEVNFVSKKAEVDVSSSTKALNYKYILEDNKSKMKVTGDKDLKSGENIVTFIVTAEDGTEKEYRLTVNKNTKIDEIGNVILGLAIIGGIGYGIYYFVKKRKSGL